MDGSKAKINIDKNILDLFWNLCDKNTNVRLNACADILHAVWKKQKEVENENELSKDLQYCVERLIKGLASPRDAARLGYTLLLTEILKKFTVVQIVEVIELMKKHLSLTGKQDKRDLIFGQLFAYTAIVRSRRDNIYLSDIIINLIDLSHGRSYILNTTYQIILDIFSQLTNENFKDVWSHLKKKLPTDWETVSAESLWLLLLCIRLFPTGVSSKYMKKHWGADDLFASDNLNNFKKIIKQTTSALPNLHPLCSEFLLLVQQRKDFNEIWNIVVDDNLFHEQSEKAFVGFEIIKFALQDLPTKKILKTVLSPKFCTIFSKSLLNAKHPMNPAATQMAEFLCTFVKNSTVPDMQIIVLKTFLQPSRTVLLDQILKKKEVSLIIQNLLPDAVKIFCEILKSLLLKKKSNDGAVDDDDKEINMKRFQAIQQIANLVAHPVMLTDLEWRRDVIKFLFLHSYFTIKETSSEIPHCDGSFESLSDDLRDSCVSAFFKTVNSLHMRIDNQQSSLNIFLEQLMKITEYTDQLMSATENLEPNFSLEKVQDSWNQVKTIVHKLKKQSKKDNLVDESNAFQALFLLLGFHLFQDPDNISEILEELHICCKKSLKLRKNEANNVESEGDEPPWIGVVIDILLSLLSKSSKHLRSLVTYIFPLFSSFIDENALQQILDVINPQKENEDMLVDEDESGGEGEEGLDFGSGSSSEDSDDEADNQPVDELFKKKVQEALGPAAEDSEAESIVLSDSEMFKLDSALSEAFKSRKKSGHTQVKSEEKTLLHFRARCFDLILAYLKSEPPMHLVLMCVEPVLAAFQLGHQSKHQKPLLHKAVSVLQFMTKMKKFKHHENVSKSELKRLLDVLIPKCHKEINLTISKKLSCLCVFIVLCYRKVTAADSEKKKSKTPSYVKTYLSALEMFVTTGSSRMLPNFFTRLMEACPDVAWYFIDPCKNYAFNTDIRLFKRTQCLGLLSESLKYSRSQKDITDEQWLDLANSVLPVAVESLKNALPDIKPVYSTELLSIIYTLHTVMNEKTGQSILKSHADELLPLLNNACSGKNTKLVGKGKLLMNRIITCLGGTVNKSKKSENSNVSNETEQTSKSAELNESDVDCVNGDLQRERKQKESSNQKKKESRNETSIVDMDDMDDNDSNENGVDIIESKKSEICEKEGHKTKQQSKKKRKSTELNADPIDCVNDNVQNESKNKLKQKKKKKKSATEISFMNVDD